MFRAFSCGFVVKFFTELENQSFDGVDNKLQSKNIIALLTDFGVKDYFVGAMKGAVLSINSAAKIVDITHEIEPQSIISASFTLRACYKDFPKKTIFVAVVDPGVGSNRRAILVKTKDYFFIAPDNGLLSFVFEETDSFQVFELTNNEFFPENVSRTFHGRDIFAPVAAHISNGVEAQRFGVEIKDFVRLPIVKPRKISESEIEAAIIHIDRFGNLVANLEKKDLPEKFGLEINDVKIENLREFYAEAANGEIFMIFGSAGFLEICVFRASAAGLLSVKAGRKIRVKAL